MVEHDLVLFFDMQPLLVLRRDGKESSGTVSTRMDGEVSWFMLSSQRVDACCLRF